MASRPPLIGVQGDAYREEDARRRDMARGDALQDQIDELRRVVRELFDRQQQAEETLTANEGAIEQQRLALEQARFEARQIAQARALDENRTRQQLADVEARVDDAVRPVRSLQAHVYQLLEAARTKMEDTGWHDQRYDELRAMIEHLAAHGDRTVVITQQLRDEIELQRGETDALRRDVMHAEDAVKIADQETRRRIVDVAQIGDAFAAHIDELRSDLGHVYDLIEETRRSTVHVDPGLEELRDADAAQRQDLERFQTQVTERHDEVDERFEVIRQEVEARFAQVQVVQEQQAERLGQRIDELAEIYGDLGARIDALVQQLDVLHQADATLRRDLWQLHEERVRFRIEQAQRELDHFNAQRRGDDPAVAADRMSRRPPDYLG